ncbi:MAG TPA: hypothetical protein VGM20_04275 [Gemmatimonadales bacterium]|jgi:hypothetical protein
MPKKIEPLDSWQGFIDSLVAGLLAAPLGMLMGSGLIQAAGFAYLIWYTVAMVPGAIVAAIFLMDIARAAIGKPMAWAPAFIEIVLRSDPDGLRTGARAPLIVGNAPMVILTHISVLALIVSKRARKAYFVAHTEAVERFQRSKAQASLDDVRSRAPGWVADQCFTKTIKLTRSEPHTGEFAVAGRMRD